MDPLVARCPAANVVTGGVKTETGALQGSEHGVSQRWVVGFWVIVEYLIHPALKRQKVGVNFNQNHAQNEVESRHDVCNQLKCKCDYKCVFCVGPKYQT